MLFVLVGFLSLKLWAQMGDLSQTGSQDVLVQEPLQIVRGPQCTFELDSHLVAEAFRGLSPKLQDLFLSLAGLREFLNHNPTYQKFFFLTFNQVKTEVLKTYSLEEFESFFVYALRLVQEENRRKEIEKQALQGISSLRFKLDSERKRLKDFYNESPDHFYQHRQDHYFEIDLGIELLFDVFGIAFSGETKELIKKIVRAKDISHELAFTLLNGIKSKLKLGDAKETLEFMDLLKGYSIEAWARDALPKLFIDINRAPTRLGQKISDILWPKKEPQNKEEKEEYDRLKDFIIRAIMTSGKDTFWTTRSILKAFRDILGKLRFNFFDPRKEMIKSWLSKPAYDKETIEAKARYLGLLLNQLDFKNWLALVPNIEKLRVKKAIDAFTILRLIRYKFIYSSHPRHLTLLELETFEFVEAPIPPEGIEYKRPTILPGEKETSFILKEGFQVATTSVSEAVYFRFQYGDVDRRFFQHPSSSSWASNAPVCTFDSREEFINRLTAAIKWKDPEHPCRYELVNRARWEFMASGGTNTLFPFGSYWEDNFNNKQPNGYGIFGADKTINPHDLRLVRVCQ